MTMPAQPRTVNDVVDATTLAVVSLSLAFPDEEVDADDLDDAANTRMESKILTIMGFFGGPRPGSQIYHIYRFLLAMLQFVDKKIDKGLTMMQFVSLSVFFS